MKYIAPERGADAFTCPLCGVYSAQRNYSVADRTMAGASQYVGEDWLSTSVCQHCGDATVWRGRVMIFPYVSSAPLPNEDMPEDVKADYQEASSIAAASPKAAAALLRLAVQKLCVHLGGNGKNINDDIKHLVQDGLPGKIQKALDIVRVVGNNAVHPGQISIDTAEDVAQLFTLVNVITDTMISMPKKIDSMYESLPAGARDAVTKRDAPKAS